MDTTTPPAARPAPPRRFGSKASEKGYILALSALLLIPMLAFTGFATDVGAWYARASRMQRAADAASLAGVVWQPNFSTATNVARETATRNGFTNGVDGVTVNVYNTGARQLRVEIIDAQVEVYFTSMFFDEVDITRDATAEYLQSLPMGSPENRMGNDPINPPTAGLPNLWLNVGSRAADKQSGDRYTNGNCTSVVAGMTTGCTGTGQNNSEYDVNGHFFAVNVEAVTAGQPLRIQVYDPGWTFQGDTCGSNNMTTTQINALVALGETTMNDGATRYASGNTNFCAGDQALNGNMAATSYIVRGPDDTPFDSRDNPVVTTCAPRTFTGRNINATGIYDRLLETSAYNDASEQGFEQIPFRQHFRQWYTICTVPSTDVDVGRYYVQVRSNPDTSGLPGDQDSVLDADTTGNPGGHNRFSIRAGFGSTGVPAGGSVGVYGEGRLPIYVNAGSTATTSFHLARMTPAYAGEVVALTFYDIGDVGTGSVNFSVSPPPDARQGSASGPAITSFSSCTIQRDGTPVLNPTVTNCGVTGMTSGVYNGRAVTVQIPIPSNYWCDETVRTNCWIRVALTFAGGATPTDTTSWTASILGDPVRLVE
jgi:hypothetical protein